MSLDLYFMLHHPQVALSVQWSRERSTSMSVKYSLASLPAAWVFVGS